MKVEPNYPGDVIILIKNKGEYSWFVSDKELLIMDLVKLENAYRRKQNFPEVKSTQANDERKGFEILTEQNVDQFLEVIKDYRVDYSELKEFCDLYNEVYSDCQPERAEPTFYIDFDEKSFHSYFDEPGSYEYFIPDNWHGYLHVDRNVSEKLLREAIGGR
jgi:hypothetical protein